MKIKYVFICILLGACFQIGCVKKETGSVAKEPSPKVTKKRPTSVYQVFVRSFYDSSGDGIGDIRGLVEKLDYLNDGNPNTQNDLGVDGLWLMPIFASPSYHGYDVTDYLKIDPDYGTMKDFELLVSECKKRGIKLFLDYVMNHTSSKHPWFIAANDSSKKFRDWYVWRENDPGWTQPWGSSSVWHKGKSGFFYGLFWQGMPDLNYRNELVQQEMTKTAKFWLNKGADGFRIDAARYLFADGPGKQQFESPSTFSFWKSFRKELKQEHPGLFLIGEIWTSSQNISKYCQGDQFDIAFQFPLAESIISAVTSMTQKPLFQGLLAAKSSPSQCWGTFLSNHDQERIFSKFHDNKDMMKNAAFLLFTLPGLPFVYYGEEIALRNGPGKDDKEKRRPFCWKNVPNGGFSKATKTWHTLTTSPDSCFEEQKQDKDSIFVFYRTLIHLRNKHSSLSKGSYEKITNTTEAIASFSRTLGKETTFVIMNLSDEVKDVSLPLFSEGRHKLDILFQDKTDLRELQTSTDGVLKVKLAGYGKLILQTNVD